MPEELRNIGEEYQRLSKDGFDAAVRSFAEVNKGFQTLAAEMTDYSKRSFEEGTATFEKLLSAKTLEQAFEIQSSYAKRAYDDYVQQMSKIGALYTDFAKEAYKPVEKAFAARR